MTWAAEHVVGVAQGAPEDVIEGLRANFTGECSEVGMYLAMSRVAYREGYPEIGEYWRRAAFEEAEHAAKFAELLGEVVTDSTKKNLEMRVEAENGATLGKFELAKLAKKYNTESTPNALKTGGTDGQFPRFFCALRFSLRQPTLQGAFAKFWKSPRCNTAFPRRSFPRRPASPCRPSRPHTAS